MGFSDRLKERTKEKEPEVGEKSVAVSVPEHPLKAGDEALRQGYLLVVALVTSADGIEDETERAHLETLASELELQNGDVERAIAFAQEPANEVLDATMEDLKAKDLGAATYLEMVLIAGADRMLGSKEEEILGVVAEEFELDEQVVALLRQYAAALTNDKREELQRILFEAAPLLGVKRDQLLGFANQLTMMEEEEGVGKLVRVIEGELSSEIRVASKEVLLLRGEVALSSLITVEADAELRIENATVNGSGNARIYADGAVRVLNSTLQGQWQGMRSSELGVLEFWQCKVTGIWGTIYVANGFACTKSEFTEIASLESEDEEDDSVNQVFLQLHNDGEFFLSESTVSNIRMPAFALLSDQGPGAEPRTQSSSSFGSIISSSMLFAVHSSTMKQGDVADTSDQDENEPRFNAVVQDCVFSDDSASSTENADADWAFFVLDDNYSLKVSRSRFAPMGVSSLVAGENTRLKLDETIFRQGSTAIFGGNSRLIELTQCSFDHFNDGCIFTGKAKLKIANCRFSDCSSSRKRGALNARPKDNNIEVSDSQFVSCSSDEDGGACRVTFGTFENVTFKNCSAPGGAAVYFEREIIRMHVERSFTNCRFTDCGNNDIVDLSDSPEVKMVNCTGERKSDFDSDIEFVDCKFTHE